MVNNSGDRLAPIFGIVSSTWYTVDVQYAYLKLPVKSDAPGRNSILARKLAPRLK